MIILRCDASSELGLGHVARCLELARGLKRHHEVRFACTLDPANQLISDCGYQIIHRNDGEHEEPFLLRLVSQHRPLLVLLDTRYPYSSRMMRNLKRAKPDSPTMTVIMGNLCQGLHECDLAVFPSAHEDESLLKAHLVGEKFAAALWGVQYVIIRDEVREARERARPVGGETPRLVVTTGGADPAGVLIRLIRLFEKLEIRADVSFLAGSSFAHRSELERMKPDLPDHLSIRPYSIEALASASAVACTFGVSIYEMIYLGMPTMCVSHNEENARHAHTLEERHPVFTNLGFIGNLEVEMLRAASESVLAAAAASGNRLPLNDRRVIDGHGASRIARRVVELCGPRADERPLV